jgi:hypothetical protein
VDPEAAGVDDEQAASNTIVAVRRPASACCPFIGRDDALVG